MSLNDISGCLMPDLADHHEYLPLTEATFFILLSLAPQPKHGYAMLKEVESLSQGRVKLSTGTLYGAIKRLLERNWIRRITEGEAEVGGRARKAYTLTDHGRRALNAEIERLDGLIHTARRFSAGEVG